MSGRPITIAGGGIAGCAAALAAAREGASPVLFEKTPYPRHRVCGEFVSAEAAPLLESLGVWGDFERAGPVRLERAVIRIGGRERRGRLPEPALGLSRYAFDALLAARVPRIIREAAADADIIATGRPRTATGPRLFGFKAHFSGPVTDSIELFFFRDAYVGVNAVERGLTNVCGLAPESALRALDFDFDALVASDPALRERVAPLSREWRWIATGPVSFHRAFDDCSRYRAGDALTFVDPFTGSGMLNALYTGRSAGVAAARGIPPEVHHQACRRAMTVPLAGASLIRGAIGNGWSALSAVVPVALLYRLTRLSAARSRP